MLFYTDFQFDSLLNEELGQDFFGYIDEAIGGTISMDSSNVFSNDILTRNQKSVQPPPLSPSDSGVDSPNVNLPLSGPDLYALSSENSDFVVSHNVPNALISGELSHPLRDDCKMDNLDVLLLNKSDLSLCSSSIKKKGSVIGEFDKILESTDMSCVDHIPLPPSPSDTFDSGVESPGVELSAFSPASSLDQPLEIIDYSDLHDIFSNNDTHFLSESFVPDNSSVNFELLPSEKLLPDCVTSKLSINNSNQLHKVEMHLPKPLSLVQPVLLDVSIPKSGIEASISTETLHSTPRSRCRKSKITSLEEKKQRKRDQNKNAATRYREKKRQEAEEKSTLYNSLNNRNKELNNQVLQMSREINYLKDLMIEVYRIKGVIPKSN